MAVHHHPVFRVHLQPGRMAHHMGREFAGELSAVRVSPQQIRLPSLILQPDDAQVDLRGILYVFEILSGSGYQEDTSRPVPVRETGGDGSQDLARIQVFPRLPFHPASG